MTIFINMLILIAGFVLLIKGADYFVEGASKIADKLGIPQIIIGLTIVAFGTSAPEAAVSISAAFKQTAENNSVDLAIGNVLGSNIMNILLILGITSVITTLAVQKNTVRFEIPFVIIVTVVLVVMGVLKGRLDFVSGLILWGIFIIFFIYLVISAKNGQGTDDIEDGKNDSWIKLIFFTVFGMAAVVWGSNLTVDSASTIAKEFGMTERLIGLTIVAFGTSLPELITSITAGLRKKADIAVGNIVGSNIFNILFVLGTACLIRNVPYKQSFMIDGICAIAAAILLFLCVLPKHRLTRTGGIIMLMCYAGYFTYLIMG